MTTTTTTNTEIQLTANELEMIKLQREKAELEAKEKELKRIADLDKQVVEREKEIEKAIELLAKQRQAAEIYFLDLESQKRGMFKLVNKAVNISKQVIDYSKDDRVVYWQKDIEEIEHEIQVVNEKYRIRVYEHLTYSSKWSRHATNNGFHMFLIGADYKDENRAIKSVKTMFNKIEAHIENAIDKKKIVDRAELAKHMALEALKSEFPDLNVKHENNWVRSSYVKEGGTYENKIVVTLENGKTFKFSYRLLIINGVDVLKLDLDGWAGFDYVEVIKTVGQLKQINS
jgi:hypothetical protein